MKRILLTQGKYTLVDDIDYKYLNQWKWHYQNVGYATRVDYANGRQIVSMAHVILKRMGFENYDRADHKNRNRLDNRRCNLRTATNSESICNQGIRQCSKSGYKGVDWFKRIKKWRARIQINGKAIHLGYFDSLIEAAKAYNDAAKKYHGEFAVLNGV